MTTYATHIVNVTTRQNAHLQVKHAMRRQPSLQQLENRSVQHENPVENVTHVSRRDAKTNAKVKGPTKT